MGLGGAAWGHDGRVPGAARRQWLPEQPRSAARYGAVAALERVAGRVKPRHRLLARCRQPGCAGQPSL